MKQIITRVDDELADAIKRRARRSGESVNSFVNRLLRTAVAGVGVTADSPRQLWKVAALTDGRLVRRGTRAVGARRGTPPKVTTPAGYVSGAVSRERDER